MKTFRLTLCLMYVTAFVRAEEMMSLEQFRDQVMHQNTGLVGSLRASQAADQRVAEKNLDLLPTVFANAELVNDRKEPVVPIVTYSRLRTDSYQAGVRQLTPFGLDAKLYFSYLKTAYVNGSSSFPFPFTYYETAPVLELTQSFGQNGMGRGTRARRDWIAAQAQSVQFSSRYQVRLLFQQAEAAYWRLAVARQVVTITQGALDQSKKLYDYNARRVRLQLVDDAEGLQAAAALRVRELEYQAAQDEVQQASRQLNTLRHKDGDDVPEQLVLPDAVMYEKSYPLPSRAARDDVKAAEADQRATAASAELSVENTKPTLDVYASLALNSLSSSVGDAYSQPFSEGRPTQKVGVRVAVPLGAQTLKNTARGYREQRDAALQIYEQKQFDASRDWKDLVQSLAEAKRRLTLFQAIEKAQTEKLASERRRLQRGRTTTYQVILFEQDYLQSALSRLRAESEVLQLLTQTKLYGETL